MSQPNTPRGSSERQRTSEDIATLASIDASENAFQKAIATWRGVDFTKLQKQLDNEASEIITNQRDDLVERKEVAQKTKDFRKLSDADKLVEYKTLLKSYQQFIDHISNHRKSTESLFLNIYNHLSEAPDPYPLLEATIDSIVSSEDVQRLTVDNNSLRTTNARLTAQAQALESRIEEVKRDGTRKEEENKRQTEKAEQGYQALLDEKTTNWEAREKALQEKMEHQERVMKEAKASYEANLRMGKVNDGSNEDVNAGASLAELELLSSDLERTTMRLQEMENRNEQLRKELSQVQSQSASTAAAAMDKERDEQDALVARLESTNSNLMKRLENAKKDGEDKIRDVEKRVKSLERENEMTLRESRTLKDKISAWSDYDDMKRELEVLKTIEFSTGDDDDEDEGIEEDEGIDSSSGKKESLEQLLLARNKKLGNELTVLRVSHQDLSDRLNELQQSYQTNLNELKSSRSLIIQLEEDLQKVQTQAQYVAPAVSVAGTYTSRYAPSQAGRFPPRGSRGSPTSSILSGKMTQGPGQGSFDQIRAVGEANQIPEQPNQGILPMITAQRDRYKQRNSQLDEELAKSHETVTSLRQEVASLQKDNLQLYEKSRYISSYTRQPSVTATSNNLNIQNNSNTSSGLSLDRYRAAYESNISPFEMFRNRESARVLHRMNPFERVINSIVRMIMRRRLTRNLFIVYFIVLHFVTFVLMLWEGEEDMGLNKTGRTPSFKPDNHGT